MYARYRLCVEDEEDEPIGPSPLEKIRATGDDDDPVSFKSDIPKIKSVASKVQSSPAYKIGTGAWSGGLVGAAKAAGTHVPGALSKPGDFLTRPEVVTALGTVIPGAGIGSAAKGILGAATKGIGSEHSKTRPGCFVLDSYVACDGASLGKRPIQEITVETAG